MHFTSSITSNVDLMIIIFGLVFKTIIFLSTQVLTNKTLKKDVDF